MVPHNSYGVYQKLSLRRSCLLAKFFTLCALLRTFQLGVQRSPAIGFASSYKLATIDPDARQLGIARNGLISSSLASVAALSVAGGWLGNDTGSGLSPDVIILTSLLGRRAVLIGTAHVSPDDAELVRQVILHEVPSCVVVELDPSRLSRLGLTDADVPQLFVPPSAPNETAGNWATEALASLLRGVLTSAYDSYSAQGLQAGCDFLAAIKSAQDVDAERITFADIKSEETLFNLLEALGKVGFFNFGVRYIRLSAGLSADLASFVAKDGAPDMNPASLIAQIKLWFRSSPDILRRLKCEIPEFYNVIIHSRDCRLSAAVSDHSCDTGTTVAVMGLAHLEGVCQNLVSRGWSSNNISRLQC